MTSTEQCSDSDTLSVDLYPKRASKAALPSRWLYTVSICRDQKGLADVAAGYRWVRQHRDIEHALLMGDGLFRITLEINEGMPETWAANQALLISEQYFAAFWGAVGLEPQANNPPVLKTSELLKSDEFVERYKAITKLYAASKPFRDMVKSDAQSFVDRQARRNRLNVSQERAKYLCTTYLLEEIAIYLLLAERGWLCDVYFGREIPTLKKIMKGEIPEAPEALKNRMNVSLQRRPERKAVEANALSEVSLQLTS